jgi:small-conductance mechanosensitive channel
VVFVPGTLLIFGIIIWASFKLAAFTEFAIGVLVMPRLRLPRGVPQTISRLSRYAVIVFGLVVAVTAAGIDFTKVAILVGGLGVGIGFGLQNVVNNFVSGLILLFERPIRAGDILEVGATSGTVEEIGMRATTVRNWQGAELIIPNANLISSDVVNWTLKHDQRRIEIPVGVAYGSSPEVVAQLLVEVAVKHPEVHADPEPCCLFMAFGDSSLDFELRAWATATSVLRIASELRFGIVDKLDETGIEIPFPQRDLHLRSAPDQTITGTAGEDGRDE